MYGPTLTFRNWMAALQTDCQGKDKLIVFEALGPTVLELLWEWGAKPSVEGISNIRRERIRRERRSAEGGIVSRMFSFRPGSINSRLR